MYERFLGKIIRLTAGHQAKIEEKPEVRKAGGVYYTPAYIVDYILNTRSEIGLGKWDVELVMNLARENPAALPRKRNKPPLSAPI